MLPVQAYQYGGLSFNSKIVPWLVKLKSGGLTPCCLEDLKLVKFKTSAWRAVLYNSKTADMFSYVNINNVT